LQNIAADFMTAQGYNEIMSNSQTKSAYYDRLTSYPASRCVRLLNPLSSDLNVMRQTLLFGMMEAVQLNINHRNADLKLYEFGNCYFYDESRRDDASPLAPYSEAMRLALTVTGASSPMSWNSKPAEASFYTLKGMVEKLLRRFGLDIYSLRAESLDTDVMADAVALSLNGSELVRMGVVSGDVCASFGIKQEVYFAEIDFDRLLKSTRKHKVAAQELSKYPEVKRDLALLIDKGVTFSFLRDIAFATERRLLKSVSLFDVYEGDRLPSGKKSYALSFVLEDKNRTLDDKTIERVMAALQSAFEKQAGAQIR